MWKNIFYEMTAPFFIFRLEAIYVLIDTAHKEAIEKGISEWEMLDLRLVPDMFPLVKQVQIVCDNAKTACCKLSWKNTPPYIDEESTIWELLVRIRKTIDFLETFVESDFEDAEKRKIEISNFENMHFTAEGYLKNYAIPNFMFHDVTIYNILRADGFDIWKRDFLHSLPLIKNFNI